MARTERIQQGRGILEHVVPSLLMGSFRRYANANGQIFAAAIAYFVVISLFPWLIFLVTVLALLQDPVLQSQVIGQIVDQFPQGARIRTEILAFVSEITVRRSGLLGAVGFLSTIIIASGAFRALRFGLNAVLEVEQKRTFLQGRAIDLLGMVAVLIFAVAATGLTAALRFNWMSDDAWLVSQGATPVRNLLRIVLPFFLSFAAFALMYRVVPEVKLQWRALWLPGLIAATGFELAKHGMALFLEYFGRFQQLYGALSVTVVVLVFVFLVANVVLLAMSLAIECNREDLRGVSPTPPGHASAN
jgi:membrane protein